MSEASDEHLYEQEIARCHMASLAVTAADPRERTGQMRSAKYHAERERVFRKVGTAATVAFLREEMLNALTGGGPDGALTRWFRLHALEFGDEINHVADLMDAGARKMISEGVADLAAESGRRLRDGEARKVCRRHGMPECGECY